MRKLRISCSAICGGWCDAENARRRALPQCPAIDGRISEADEVADEAADKGDAAIVGSAHAVETYEMARYGTLIAWAEKIGHDDIIPLLNTNLNEEKATDKKLSTVALRKGVNRKAAS
jgi:ferritin-like metal-binding protein YciE